MNPIRKRKIEKEAVRTIASLISQDRIKDPRVQAIISVHRSEIADDMTKLDVWITALISSNKQKKKLLEGLNHASGYIQSVVGNELRLRITPKIRFHWDDEAAGNWENEKFQVDAG